MTKIEYEYQIQGNYGSGDRFEEVHAESTLSEAQQRLREYRENEPGIRFRIIKWKVKTAA